MWLKCKRLYQCWTLALCWSRQQLHTVEILQYCCNCMVLRRFLLQLGNGHCIACCVPKASSPALCHPYPEICTMNGSEDVAYHKSTCVGPRQGQYMVNYEKSRKSTKGAYVMAFLPKWTNKIANMSGVCTTAWLVVVCQIPLEGNIQTFIGLSNNLLGLLV